jgi:large subunit ribosomal protein L24
MDKIRKGDQVVVTNGKDNGKRGTVLARIDETHVLVEGINRAKKHVKPNPVKGVVGGIVEIDRALDISNVALFNPGTKKADRVGIRTLEDGRKVRFFKSNGELVDA